MSDMEYADLDDIDYEESLEEVKGQFTQQTKRIYCSKGVRWVLCLMCNTPQLITNCVSYGGINRVNSGICRQCDKKRAKAKTLEEREYFDQINSDLASEQTISAKTKDEKMRKYGFSVRISDQLYERQIGMNTSLWVEYCDKSDIWSFYKESRYKNGTQYKDYASSKEFYGVLKRVDFLVDWLKIKMDQKEAEDKLERDRIADIEKRKLSEAEKRKSARIQRNEIKKERILQERTLAEAQGSFFV